MPRDAENNARRYPDVAIAARSEPESNIYPHPDWLLIIAIIK